MNDGLKEILAWSIDRPAWQQDALRRLVEKGDLDADDLAELKCLAKVTHGMKPDLAKVPTAQAFSGRGLSAGQSGSSDTQPISTYAVVGETNAGVTAFGEKCREKRILSDQRISRFPSVEWLSKWIRSEIRLSRRPSVSMLSLPGKLA